VQLRADDKAAFEQRDCGLVFGVEVIARPSAGSRNNFGGGHTGKVKHGPMLFVGQRSATFLELGDDF
jgi:hypothetical protein